MLASSIVDLIEQRRARIRQKCAANRNEQDLVNLRIAEEYDALIAEIDALRKAMPHSHSPFDAVREFPEDRSEEWILGDQGQLGG